MINKPKGTQDIDGEKSIKYEYVSIKLKDISSFFNFNYIETPTFERSEVFNRLGEESDILSKEMYEFEDKSGRRLSLKPEGTAPVARYVSENKIINTDSDLPKKFFYIDNMFRYDRPQKGRLREFKQFGVEFFSKKDISNDFEIIQFIERILKEFKINNYIIKVNSIGSSHTRDLYAKKIRKILNLNKDKLSDYAKERINGNVLRVLDSKNKNDINIVKKLPKLNDSLSEFERNYFESFVDLLKKNNVKYEIDPRLVRGLDYYNDIVFEVQYSSSSEKSNILLGGGRYDNLVGDFSNRSYNSIGFALGIERLVSVIDWSGIEIERKKTIYIGLLTKSALNKYSNLHTIVKNDNIKLSVDYNIGMKLKNYFNASKKVNSDFHILLGDKEVNASEFEVSDNQKKKKIKIKGSLVKILSKEINKFL